MSFLPLNTDNNLGNNFNQINDMIRQLSNEQVTKTFKQPGGNSIIEGKLPYNGGYGSLYYDSDGIPRIVIGIQPDGTVGLTVSKPGQSVLTVFT